MSLLDQVYAVPSRVEGVVRLLATRRSRRMSSADVEQLLSPDALITAPDSEGDGPIDRAMVQAAIRECIGLRLVVEAAGALSLADDVPDTVSNLSVIRPLLSPLIRTRIFDRGIERNHDLANAIAWYLTQDALSPPGNLTECQSALSSHRAAGYLSLNDNQFQMLTYWGVYLGFARLLPLGASLALAPEPTAALREGMAALMRLRSSTTVQIDDFVAGLAAECAAFEGGSFRETAELFGPRRADRTLSSTTSHALLSLEEMGEITLTAKADAPAYVLADPSHRRAVSEISWTAPARAA